jgi:hypothetical protein
MAYSISEAIFFRPEIYVEWSVGAKRVAELRYHFSNAFHDALALLAASIFTVRNAFRESG